MDAADSVGHPGVAGDEAQLIAGLNQLYRGRWRFWRSLLGFHARRVGDFWQQHEAGAPLYALRDPDLGRLWVLVQAQEDNVSRGGQEATGPAPGCVHSVQQGRASGPP